MRLRQRTGRDLSAPRRRKHKRKSNQPSAQNGASHLPHGHCPECSTQPSSSVSLRGMISARLGYRLTPQTKRGAAVSALTTLIAIGGQEGFLSDSVFRRAQSKTAVYFPSRLRLASTPSKLRMPFCFIFVMPIIENSVAPTTHDTVSGRLPDCQQLSKSGSVTTQRS